MHNLMKQLVGAYAPKHIQDSIAKIEELNREKRALESDARDIQRHILNEASHAQMHAAIENATR